MTKHPIITKSNTVPELYRDIFPPQPDPTREFILKRCTYKEVYRLAAGIRQLQSQREESRTQICLCTDNKALIAAAIIASLAEGPHIVLPYAFSRQAVKEVFDILSPSLILTDQPVDYNEIGAILETVVEGEKGIYIMDDWHEWEEIAPVLKGEGKWERTDEGA